MKTQDQEIMNDFYFGSLMQGHSAQKNHCILVDIGGSCVLRKLVS